jgi:AcrR family transcriptional regulator
VSARASDIAATDDSRKRRPFRREQILEAAVNLFNERGYYDTGMNDIGAAVGITGPGIYRHFPNKQAILETAIALTAEDMLERVDEIVRTSETPRETLERLVLNSIDVFLDNPSLVITAVHERRNLSDAGRALFDRSNRLRVEEWAHPLGQIRPELTDNEARFLAIVSQQMLLAAGRFVDEMGRDYLRQFLFNLAMAVLMTETPRSS